MMRLKRAFILISSIILVLIIIMLYSAKDLSEYTIRKKTGILENDPWLHFENRMKQLENHLHENHKDVNEIKAAINNILASNSTNAKSFTLPKKDMLIQSKSLLTITEMLYDSKCPLQVNIVPKTDIQMLDLYERIPFDNIDGGAWKQGWKIEVNEKDWNRQNKLQVFVVPHSHNDPGWTQTFEDYYLRQTKQILNNMLVKLPEDPRRKFIWAEISYFALWWEDIGEEEREAVKRLIRNNQLEMVTGGWVMNDEANSHWISIIGQMTEGHQWLQQNLNYTPVSSWSIDPFGMSLTQPALLKKMHLKNSLIHRIHYSVKKELARKQQLEFRWRQLWDGTGDTDMFTHMMPFYSYDVPHSCGPDPKICCQFDFKRLKGYGLHCPWKVPPEEITEKNVAIRASMLLDQYRKKSRLYKTNVVLAPLGDDFRYDHPAEWDAQYNNYQKLFDYMNSNLDLNVRAQFGTLTDYFNAVHKAKSDDQFPSLSGDFFTYSDRDDHYWSGYFTSRPFHKRMDRNLLAYIRAAETILSLAFLSGKPGSTWIADREVGLEHTLSQARKELALFQHHDGITGTAKDHVVNDYGKRMLEAITACQHVIQHSAHILLSGKDAETPDKSTKFYNIDDVRSVHDAMPEKCQITIGPELRRKRIAIFNSLSFARSEIVTFHISTPNVEVLNMKGERIPCQISPIFEYGTTMSHSKYQISFVANIPALGLISYIFNALWPYEVPAETVSASVKIYNYYDKVDSPPGIKQVEVSPRASEFTLQNNRATAIFSNLGLLKAIKVGVNTIPVHLDFAKYGVRQATERSGAYLFLPDGDAVALNIENTIVKVISGPLMSSVTVQLPYINHCVTMYNSSGADGIGIEIKNTVDIRKTSNFELAMRLSTTIANSDLFYTDVNAYEIVKRKRFAKLPLQANYYPMPSIAYIQDKKTRLTIVTGAPLGVSSLKSGEIEVMLDRRLNQDDNLGMGQGVLDNRPVQHVFRLILEQKTHSCQATVDGHPSGFPSLAAHVASETLLNPLVRLLRIDDDDSVSQAGYASVDRDLGVDFVVSTLRTGVTLKGRDFVGIIVHRQFIDVCYADRIQLEQFPLSDGTFHIGELLTATDDQTKLFKTSLTFLHMENEIELSGEIAMCPMDIQAYVLQRHNPLV